MSDFEWLSWILDICPGIGEAKAVLELISGKDLITQEDLDAFDIATCAISIIPAVNWLAKIAKHSRAAKNLKKFKHFFALVQFANESNDAVDIWNVMRKFLEENGCDTSNKKLNFDKKTMSTIRGLDLFPIKAGKYIIHSTINYKYVWDIDIPSSNLQLWERHGGLNQQFIFKPSLSGLYTISCVENGKYLDCAYSRKDNGATVWTYEFNDTSAQHWIIRSVNQSKILGLFNQFTCYTQIDHSTTKRCIDLKYSDAKNGQKIWLYGDNGTDAQKWYLEPI